MERVGLRLQLRKQQAEAGDIVLLYGDESEALTHPYLARAWAKSGADLRVPAPGQAKKVAILGSLDPLTRQLIVHTSPTKRSSDFIAHLEQLDRLFGPQPGRQAKPVVLVEDNGPIHTSKRSLAALTARAHGSPSNGCRNTPPNSTTSSRSGAISKPITSPTRPSPTPPRSTRPSITLSLISTASASPIRWPCHESLLNAHTKTNQILWHHSDMSKPDERIDMSDEPDHDALCEREQRYLLKAIDENIDLTDHMNDAVKSLKIVIAADQSIHTGQVVALQ